MIPPPMHKVMGDVLPAQAAHLPLGKGNERANPAYRMRPVRRIAKPAVKQPGGAPGKQRHGLCLTDRENRAIIDSR